MLLQTVESLRSGSANVRLVVNEARTDSRDDVVVVSFPLRLSCVLPAFEMVRILYEGEGGQKLT